MSIFILKSKRAKRIFWGITSLAVGCTAVWFVSRGAVVPVAAAAILTRLVLIPPVLAFIHHANCVKDIFGGAGHSPTTVAEPSVHERYRRVLWGVACLFLGLLIYSGSAASVDHHAPGGAGATSESPNEPHFDFYSAPGYAGKRWFAEGRIQDAEPFDAGVSFTKGLQKDSPIEIDGLTSGPIRVRLKDEFANPAEGVVECSDHGMPIGTAQIRFLEDNSVDLSIQFTDGRTKRSSFTVSRRSPAAQLAAY